MLKQWEEGAIELYFNDFENEKDVKQSFSNLKPGISESEVGSFQEAMSGLVNLPGSHAIVVEKYRYLKD